MNELQHARANAKTTNPGPVKHVPIQPVYYRSCSKVLVPVSVCAWDAHHDAMEQEAIRQSRANIEPHIRTSPTAPAHARTSPSHPFLLQTCIKQSVRIAKHVIFSRGAPPGRIRSRRGRWRQQNPLVAELRGLKHGLFFKDPCTLNPSPWFWAAPAQHGHSGSSLISFNDIGYWYWFDTKWRGEEEAIRAQPERGPSWHWLRNPT